MDTPITPRERAELAEKSGLSDQYLYQCLSRKRDMDATTAACLERDTKGRIRRWQVRRDWHLTWPELVGADGAPVVRIPKAKPRTSKSHQTGA